MAVGVAGVVWFLFLAGLAPWVGGTVTGQIMMARSKAFGDNLAVVALTREISWMIPHVYIPAGIVAIGAGVVLVFLSGVRFLSVWVLFPILMYLGIVIVGTVYSLPEYRRLNEMFAERGKDDQAAHRRLATAAWVNRVELVVVLIALFGIVTGATSGT